MLVLKLTASCSARLSEGLKWTEIAAISYVLKVEAKPCGCGDDSRCADKWQIEVLHLAGAYRQQLRERRWIDWSRGGGGGRSSGASVCCSEGVTPSCGRVHVFREEYQPRSRCPRHRGRWCNHTPRSSFSLGSDGGRVEILL